MSALDPLHRRTIRSRIMAITGWKVVSHVDGTVEVRPPASVPVAVARAEVLRIVEGMGYTPTIVAERNAAGATAIIFHTPETLAQSGRGGHGFIASGAAGDAGVGRIRAGRDHSGSSTTQTPRSRAADSERAAARSPMDAPVTTMKPAAAPGAGLDEGIWRTIFPSTRMSIGPFAAPNRERPRLGPPPAVVHMEIDYTPWDGEIGPWSEHFGKGKQQVRSLDGSEPLRSCNEVEVVKRLRASGLHAFWVSSYNPSKLPTIWRPFALAPLEMPGWLQDIDRRIRRVTGHTRGGIPDVVGWNPMAPGDTAIFVECKGKDSIKEGQEDWVYAAVANGISKDRFAVAIRNSA